MCSQNLIKTSLQATIKIICRVYIPPDHYVCQQFERDKGVLGTRVNMSPGGLQPYTQWAGQCVFLHSKVYACRGMVLARRNVLWSELGVTLYPAKHILSLNVS